MNKKSIIWLCMLLLMSAGCSSDDDYDSIIVNPKLIVGEWEASHQSKNPKYGDTADMISFKFNADGTGSSELFSTKSFRYEIEGNRITVHLTNTESYYGQIVFEYTIVKLSRDEMEWDEIPNEYWSDNSLYLRFSRN